MWTKVRAMALQSVGPLQSTRTCSLIRGMFERSINYVCLTIRHEAVFSAQFAQIFAQRDTVNCFVMPTDELMEHAPQIMQRDLLLYVYQPQLPIDAVMLLQ
jgi:hypothetical protein